MAGQAARQQERLQLPKLGRRGGHVSLPSVLGHEPHQRLVLGSAEPPSALERAGAPAAPLRRRLRELQVLTRVRVAARVDDRQLAPGDAACEHLTDAPRLGVQGGGLKTVLAEVLNLAMADAVVQESAHKGRGSENGIKVLLIIGGLAAKPKPTTV